MGTAEATSLVALGAFIRSQRQAAGLSLRQLAAQSQVSNAYLSQIERGLHQPSLKVLGAIARALDLGLEDLLAEAGLGGSRTEADSGNSRARTLGALRADSLLTPEQREAMINLYKIFVTGQAAS